MAKIVIMARKVPGPTPYLYWAKPWSGNHENTPLSGRSFDYGSVVDGTGRRLTTTPTHNFEEIVVMAVEASVTMVATRCRAVSEKLWVYARILLCELSRQIRAKCCFSRNAQMVVAKPTSFKVCSFTCNLYTRRCYICRGCIYTFCNYMRPDCPESISNNACIYTQHAIWMLWRFYGNYV